MSINQYPLPPPPLMGKAQSLILWLLVPVALFTLGYVAGICGLLVSRPVL